MAFFFYCKICSPIYIAHDSGARRKNILHPSYTPPSPPPKTTTFDIVKRVRFFIRTQYTFAAVMTVETSSDLLGVLISDRRLIVGNTTRLQTTPSACLLTRVRVSSPWTSLNFKTIGYGRMKLSYFIPKSAHSISRVENHRYSFKLFLNLP